MALPRKAPSKEKITSKIAAYQRDPVLFFREVLGFEPWSKQADLARSIPDHRYVMCRSGHKVGKTTVLGAAALWWVSCFPRSRVVLTAPAAPQIERGIWSEIKRLYHGAKVPIGGKLNETPWSGLTFEDGRDVFGRSTNRKENFAGISAPNLLILVDEASGIDEEIWEAIYGNLGGNGRVVGISNPTQLSGRFYEAFHSSRAQWCLHHISSEDTPNFHGGSVPGLAAPEWAGLIEAEYGKPSAHYDVRVLGNFPSQAENSVIGFGLVEAAIRRGRIVEALRKGTLSPQARDELGPDLAALEALVVPKDPLVVGVDVARFGDDSTAFVPVRGRWMGEAKTLEGYDTQDVAGRAYVFAREQAHPGESPLIRVDANGLGAGVYDNIRRRQHIRSMGVNVSTTASDPTKYARTRDELWFGMRDWLHKGGILPPFAKRLHAELVTPTYTFDNKGRYKVESKDDVKKRVSTRRSPDVADAACLAVSRVLQASRGDAIKELRGALRGRSI